MPIRNPNALLTTQPERIPTKAHSGSRKRAAAVPGSNKWIRGPMPLQDFTVGHPMDMQCSCCTFVLQQSGRFLLKYVNRHCRYHEHLIGVPEVTG